MTITCMCREWTSEASSSQERPHHVNMPTLGKQWRREDVESDLNIILRRSKLRLNTAVPVYCSTAQHSTAQHSTEQRSAAQPSPAQPSSAGGIFLLGAAWRNSHTQTGATVVSKANTFRQ